MSRRLPYVLVTLTIALFLATLWFAATDRGGCVASWAPSGSSAARECDELRKTADVAAPWEKIAISGLGAAFVLLGGFLLVKAKGNRYGLVFCIEGLLFVLTGFGEAYTVHGLVEAELPGASAVGVISEIVGGPIIFLPFAFFFLLYPTGRLPSGGWRVVAWGAAVSGASLLVTSTFGGRYLRLARLHENPVHIPAIDRARGPVEVIALVIFLVCLLASIVSLVIRFRRARGVERQQIRWFATAGSFIAIVLTCGPIFWASPSLEFLWGPLFVTAMASLPVAAAIAILRYRLYEIDLIINRALVYGLLTFLIATFYVGFVFALQTVLPLRPDSDVAVAASTLAAAALFRPLRARIQDFIDKRFYRRKYDGGRTLEGLAQKLRNEVQLETVTEDVYGVLGSTVQPSHASLWIKGALR